MATIAGIDATAGALGSSAAIAITYPLQSVSYLLCAVTAM